MVSGRVRRPIPGTGPSVGLPTTRRRGVAPGRGLLLALVLAPLLLADVLTGSPAQARKVPPAQIVSDVLDAYRSAATGNVLRGSLAVAVARQHRPRTGLSPAAVDRRVQRTTEAYADNGAVASRPFPSASMVKLFIAEDILHRARTGGLTLDGGDYGLLSRMLRSSDDPAASRLWVRYGGNRMVVDVARRYGLTGTSPTTVPGQWGQVMTTAADLARFLSLVPVVAHPLDAAWFFGWLERSTPIAADGFDQSFGLFGTGDGERAVKQGWMCCVGGNRHVHSVGVVGRKVVVLLTEVPRSSGYDDVRAALTAAAAEVPVRGRP